MTSTSRPTVVLGGAPLTLDQLDALSVESHPVIEFAPEAVERVERSYAFAREIVQRRAAYGRTTGVGANRDVVVDLDVENDLRLLHSHASGAGEPLDVRTTRAAMIVRLNQILQGGSGLEPSILSAMREALQQNKIPRVQQHGGIGTGDLTALGEIALALMGELPFHDGTRQRLWQPSAGDALPLLSSNAVTAAIAAAARRRLLAWLEHHDLTAALTLLSISGSAEPLAARVQDARPHRGQHAVAARQRELIAPAVAVPARIQDSFGFRTLPQVVGPLRAAIDDLDDVLEVEINAAPENPLIAADVDDIFHNGNFHAMSLALALDRVKLALAGVTGLSVARLTDLAYPTMTRLAPFLAVGPPGSSGIMMLEYTQAAAQARLRHAAAPATLGSVVISRGVENHSSFATQAAEQLAACVEAAADVLASELVAAVRTYVISEIQPVPASELESYFERVRALISEPLTDRSLAEDLGRVRSLVAAEGRSR